MTPAEKPKTGIDLSPTPDIQDKTKSSPTTQILAGSKGLIIAVIIAIIAIVIGFSALFGYKSADQYQGYLKKVEDQTEDLKSENNKTPDIADIIHENSPLPASLPE
jgi:cytoskeletal protein RodZ